MRKALLVYAAVLLATCWLCAQDNSSSVQGNGAAQVNSVKPDTAADLADSPPTDVDAVSEADPAIGEYANPTGLSIASTFSMSGCWVASTYR